MIKQIRAYFHAHHLALSVALVGLALLGFKATALAATAAGVDSSSSILDLARPVFDAFSGGHYAYAGSLLVILLVALAKRYAVPKEAFLRTDAGGAIMALTAAMATAMAAALAAPGASVTLSLLESSLLVGVGAAGGYTVLKDLLVEPILRPLAARCPAWTQPIWAVLFWIFEGSGAAGIAKSEAAGAAAVKADPGQGVAAIVPPPAEIK